MKKVIVFLAVAAIAIAAFFLLNQKNNSNTPNKEPSVLPSVTDSSVKTDTSSPLAEDNAESVSDSGEDNIADDSKIIDFGEQTGRSPVPLSYQGDEAPEYTGPLPEDLLPVKLSGMAILFPYDKDIPYPYCSAVIKSFADQYLEKKLSSNVLVEGDACTYGTEEHNEDLSRRRAEYLKNELVKRGIPAERITIKYYGSKRFGKMGFGLRPHHRRAGAKLM